MKRYKLLKDYYDPNGTIMAGVIKDTHQWMARFALLNESDFDIKYDWFEFVPDTVTEKPNQLGCTDYFNSKGEKLCEWSSYVRLFEQLQSVLEDKFNKENDAGNLPLPDDYIDTSEKELYATDGKGNKFPLSDLYHMKYTQSEVDAMMLNVWEAARKMNGSYKLNIQTLKYPFYEDYKNSLTETPQQQTSAPQPSINTKEEVISDNSDVACLSLNDLNLLSFYKTNYWIQLSINDLKWLIKEKLKQ